LKAFSQVRPPVRLAEYWEPVDRLEPRQHVARVAGRQQDLVLPTQQRRFGRKREPLIPCRITTSLNSRSMRRSARSTSIASTPLRVASAV
jgi:hypothetical protein